LVEWGERSYYSCGCVGRIAVAAPQFQRRTAGGIDNRRGERRGDRGEAMFQRQVVGNYVKRGKRGDTVAVRARAA